jgi:hypothetical protein
MDRASLRISEMSGLRTVHINGEVDMRNAAHLRSLLALLQTSGARVAHRDSPRIVLRKVFAILRDISSTRARGSIAGD